MNCAFIFFRTANRSIFAGRPSPIVSAIWTPDTRIEVRLHLCRTPKVKLMPMQKIEMSGPLLGDRYSAGAL